MPPRDKRIIITLSTEEWTVIKQSANAQGLSVSAYMRQAALNRTKEEGK